MASIINKYIDSTDFATATAIYDDINLTAKSADGVYKNNSKYRTQLNGLLGPIYDCPSCITSTLVQVCYDPSSEDEVCCNCEDEPETVLLGYNGLVSALNCSQMSNSLINLTDTYSDEFELGDYNIRSISTTSPVPDGLYRAIHLRDGVVMSDGNYLPNELTNASESISDYVIQIVGGQVTVKDECTQ